MANNQIVRHRRGTKDKVIAVTAKPGEILPTTDTGELYVNPSAGTEQAPVPVKIASENILGVIAESQLPASVRTILGAWTNKGTWNGTTGNVASLNEPMAGFAVASPLPAAAPENNGFLFIVVTDGNFVVDGYSDWNDGDFIVSDGTKWRPVENSTNADIDGGVIA